MTALIAQLVERMTRNHEVCGSTPHGSIFFVAVPWFNMLEFLMKDERGYNNVHCKSSIYV